MGRARQRRLLALATLACVLPVVVFRPGPVADARAPSGFADQRVVGGLRSPTSFAALPDGRILVAELAGRVRVVERGRLLRRPLLDLKARVNASGGRGLVAIALDPRFVRTRVLYLYYAFEDDPRRPLARKSMRLTRVTLRGSRSPGLSERVVLGGGCAQRSRAHDCIPADCTCHVGGAIAFDGAGRLLLSTGDGASPNSVNRLALRAQDVDSLAGKLLRVAPSGSGLPSNPFWRGRPDENRAKVWAYGLRNPFRFTLRPGSGAVIAGDVGWRHWEELDVVPRGANLGWPCEEGPRSPPGYARQPLCRALARRGGVTHATYVYPRGEGASVVGGVFLTGDRYPQSYRGAYVFGDFVRGWIRFVRLDARGRPLAPPRLLDARAAGVVALGLVDGELLYLSLTRGELRRIRRPE
jgi:glucose/arabinose dehydrogenase